MEGSEREAIQAQDVTGTKPTAAPLEALDLDLTLLDDDKRIPPLGAYVGSWSTREDPDHAELESNRKVAGTKGDRPVVSVKWDLLVKFHPK